MSQIRIIYIDKNFEFIIKTPYFSNITSNLYGENKIYKFTIGHKKNMCPINN